MTSYRYNIGDHVLIPGSNGWGWCGKIQMIGATAFGVVKTLFVLECEDSGEGRNILKVSANAIIHESQHYRQWCLHQAAEGI